MTVDRLINMLVMVTLVEMMAATGLGVTYVEVAGVARSGRLVARALVANYVFVPAATVGLLLIFHSQPLVAAGFLILAVCPGAPYGPPFTAIANGNVAVAIGLMVILAGSSAIIAPLSLRFLLPLVSPEQPLEIDPVKIVCTLLVTQLVPLCAAISVRQWKPVLADRLLKPAVLISKVLNLVAVGTILVVQSNLLLAITGRAFVGMLTLLIISWAIGYLLGGQAPDTRKAMTLTTSLRNVGVGLVIAAGSFPATPAVTAVLAYGVIEILGSLLLAFVFRNPISPGCNPHDITNRQSERSSAQDR